jgi:hypothetical protein
MYNPVAEIVFYTIVYALGVYLVIYNYKTRRNGK